MERDVPEAGYPSIRMDAQRRVLLLLGRTREWCIVLGVKNGWLNTYTMVCPMPDAEGVRARTMETLLRLKQRRMQLPDGRYVDSATDLNNHFECRHLTGSGADAAREPPVHVRRTRRRAR